MEEKDLALLMQKAEELLGRKLAPRDDPAFLRDLHELAKKDPALAKALVAGPKARGKEVERAARKAESAVRASARAAQFRESLRQFKDRLFALPMSIGGRLQKVPNKRTVLLAVLVLALVALGAGVLLTSGPQRSKTGIVSGVGAGPAGSEAGQTATNDAEAKRLAEATSQQLQEEAAKTMGRPVPPYGTPEYEAYMKELREKNPTLAEKLQEAQVAQASIEEATTMASQDLTGIASGLQGVPPGGTGGASAPSTPGTGGTTTGTATTPPPPTPVPPPPPPTAVSGEDQGGYGTFALGAQNPPRPMVAGEAPAGQDQGGEASRGRGFLLVETGTRQPMAQQSQEAGRKPMAAEVGSRAGGGSPAPGSGGGPAPSPGGGTLFERQPTPPLVVSGSDRARGGVLTVLAEPKGTSGPQGSQAQTPEAQAPAPTQMGNSLPMGLPPITSTPPANPAPAQATSQESPTASPTTPSSLPYIPGRTYTARLNFQLVVAEGGTSPVVLEGADGSIFTGTARLDPALGRVMVDLDTLYLRGQTYSIRAMVYDNQQLGLSAQIREEAPTLAQDIIRAAASGFSRYVDLLSKQSSVSVLPGGGVASSFQAPPLEFVLLGEVGKLFSVPNDRRSLVRLAQVEQGKVVQVMFLGGR